MTRGVNPHRWLRPLDGAPPQVPVAFATRHDKQPLVGPPLAALGIRVVRADVDTDRFGTFAGDVPRPGTAQETVGLKARAAARAAGCRFGLASEGTFTPHPAAPLLTVDVELVALVDLEHEVVVTGRAQDVAGTACTAEVAPHDDLERIGHRAGLPGYAVVVRPTGRAAPVCRGVADLGALADAVREMAARSAAGSATVTTDFRAHLHAGRRAVIARAAADLATRLGSACPHCGGAGWGVESTRPGLPCLWCGTPTGELAEVVHRCPACGGDRADPVPLPGADPRHCPRCNP